jgi:hypothetical protein
MRPFAALILAFLLMPELALADPEAGFRGPSVPATLGKRVQVGAAEHWSPARFQDRVSFGLGWSVPRRLYDADGQLLTERSLLFPGLDLERTGLYLALRF